MFLRIFPTNDTLQTYQKAASAYASVKYKMNSRCRISTTKIQSCDSYSEPSPAVTFCIALAYPQEEWEFSTIKTNSEEFRFQALLFHDIIIIGGFHFLRRKMTAAIRLLKLHLKHETLKVHYNKTLLLCIHTFSFNENSDIVLTIKIIN